MKLLEVVHFRFENPPEALHRAVVDAAAGPGHTLSCMDTVQLCFELPVGVLIAPVAVKQRMGAGVGSHRSVKGVKNKLIVVGSAQRIRNDAFIMEIKDRGNDTVSVNYRCERGWKESPADRVLVAVGRRPNMSKVLADDCQVQLENGRPLIKGTYRTTQENVYAIGDTVARKRLAHVAASHAAYLVENLAGRGHRMQLSVVPNGMYVVLPVVPTCIYTEPEIAAVGFTENDARLYNMKIKCGVAYMPENGKALLARNSRGFVRLIFEAYTNTLIGAQIMCARATDMIGEMATAIANGLTAYQLSTAMRAHPTYSEAITEAIKDALKNG